MSAAQPRRGSALVVVLVALAVTSLAATAAIAVARTLQADARGAVAGVRARAAADGALATVLTSWPADWTQTLAPGAAAVRTVTSAAGTATVRAVRLDTRRYFLTGEATSPALAGPLGPAARRLGVYAQLEHLAFTTPAAIVAAGPLNLGLDTEVRAADAPPTGWLDCTTPTESPAAAGAAAPSIQLATGARVLGTVLTDPAAWTPPGTERFGDLDRATLAARADIVLTAGGIITPIPRATTGSNPACVRDRTSWGDPYRGTTAVAPCTTDYPVVYLRGTSTTILRGPARFQGTLIADGPIEIIGRVEVAGLIVSAGTVSAASGTLVVDGSLVSRGSNSSTLGASSRIRRSRCALERVALAAARPLPLPRRAWLDVVR